jgi:hypothetical protein
MKSPPPRTRTQRSGTRTRQSGSKEKSITAYE